MLYPVRRSLHQAIIKLMLLSLFSSTLAGLIPPPLVRSVAPEGVAELAAALLPEPAVALAAGTISGKVFRDFNSDGQLTANGLITDTGVSGVTVTVYDASGTAQGSATTSSTGAYSLSASGTGPYRVEFTTLPTGYYPTTHNSNSGSNTAAPNSTATTAGTTVQFVPDGNSSNVNLGINVPTDYSQVNPKVVLPVFKPGNTGPAMQTFSYDAPKTGNGMGIPQVYSATTGVENPVSLATPAQIGVTWGLAYQRTQKRIFTTALLRRHAALADGPGYVYMLDPTSGYLGKFNLAGVTPATGGPALNFGAVTRTASGLSTDDNNVSGELNRDLDAFAKVGKMGFGDADIDETGNTLWAVNLFERTLLAIDVSGGTATLNNAAPATLQPLVREYDIASLANVPSCAGTGVLRPWGLGFEQGKGYLGLVCDASISNNVVNLDAYVVVFDPSNPSAGFAPTPAVSFGLDYNRELASAFSTNGQFGAWKAWTDSWTVINATTSAAPAAGTSPVNHHMPLVSDIDFTDNGSMVIGLLDRNGFMLGFGNYMPVAGSTSLTAHNAAGDILQACHLTGAFVLEGTGGCTVQDDGGGTTIQSTGANYVPPQPASITNDGPSNNGEFYYQDTWARTSGHNEISLGSLAVLPGRDEVVYTVYDPLGFNPFVNTNPFGLNTNGIHYDNTTTGVNQDGYLLFTGLNNGENVNTYVDKRFGKSGGLGDLEVLADPAPIEIGNRVWLDSDGDGVQDPNEAPISGVIVELYKNGVKVGQATTDATGEYYFVSGANATDANTSDNIIHDSGLGIIPGTGTSGGNSLYEIRIPNVSGGSKQAALGTNILTTANVGSNDSIDSDGTASGVNASYTIPYADLASAGSNNHTYDFGFTPPPGTIQIVKQTTGGNGSFGYSSSNATLDTVHLTTVGGTASSSVMTLSAGSYPLSEDALVGWSLTGLTCTGDSDGGNVVALANRQVTIDLDAGESQLCTFSNTAQSSSVTPSGVLTLTKTVNGAGTGPFNLTVAGSSGYISTTTINDGETKLFTGLAQGVYTVTESSPGAGWTTVYTATASTGSATGGNTNAIVNLQTNNTATLATTPISGRVYRDFNSDGQITANGVITDTGVSGVTITAYNKSGASVGSATSDATGNYTLNPSGTGPYRIAFSNLPSGYEPTTHGGQNGTSTQFVNTVAGASNINLGINYPADYSQTTNPTMAQPVHGSGDPLLGGTAANNLALATFPYNAATAPLTVTTAANTGALWGLAWQSSQQKLYASAVVRRHAGFGSLGAGGIYVYNRSTGTTTPFVDVNTLGVNVGALTGRGLPASKTSPSLDTAAFAAVGKVGIGDIDISEDGQTLWGVNVNAAAPSLFRLNVSTGVAPTNADNYPLSTLSGLPSCTNGVLRPWALKFRAGIGYLGAVCDASSGTRNNLVGYVLSFNPNNVNAGMTTVISVPLNYTKGPSDSTSAAAPVNTTQWYPWTDTYSDAAFNYSGTPSAGGGEHILSRPTPILADIEIDEFGDFILGFADRAGWQVGAKNYPPTSTAYTVNYRWSGDGLLVCQNASGNLTVESNGACGSRIGAGVSNSDGPGGGEFFADLFTPHQEIIAGGLAVLMGSNEVAMAALDPLAFATGGVNWNSTVDGSIKRGIQTYAGANDASGYFGKAGGIGDVELLVDPAPIEIGNRVWDDLDGDGVQDPGEPGLSGLQVSLQGPTNTVTTNTDANGLYYFNNLRPYTAYTLTVNVPSSYSLTAANQAALSGASVGSNHAISDTLDSDAALIGGKATIYYSTGSAGQNNHGLDFGFTQPVSGQVDIVNTAPSTVDLALVKTASITGATPGVAFNYTLTVTNQSTTTTATNVTLSDPLPAGVLYSGATASGGSGGACSYNSGTRTVTCTWATLPPGQQGVATITVMP